MKVMKATSAMTSPPQAGDDGPQLIKRGLTGEPVMSPGMMARMATMHMRMRRKKYHNLMMDQSRMWRTDGIVGLTWELVMSTGMSARMLTIRMRKRRNQHRKPMMDQSRMRRTKGIVLERVKIRLYISDL